MTEIPFIERVDAHINLCNDHLKDGTDGPGVGASVTYATARFNAWLCGEKYLTAEQMKEGRDFNIEGLTAHYKQMLEENYDQYVQHFDVLFPAVKAGTASRTIQR